MFFIGQRNWEYNSGIQTTADHFEIDPTCVNVWETGVSLLGTPQFARLTTFPCYIYLDMNEFNSV